MLYCISLMTGGLIFDTGQRERDTEVIWKGLYYKVWTIFYSFSLELQCWQVLGLVCWSEAGDESHEGAGGGNGEYGLS